MHGDSDLRLTAADLFGALLRREHLCKPSDLARVVAEEAQRSLGARSSGGCGHADVVRGGRGVRRGPCCHPPSLDG